MYTLFSSSALPSSTCFQHKELHAEPDAFSVFMPNTFLLHELFQPPLGPAYAFSIHNMCCCVEPYWHPPGEDVLLAFVSKRGSPDY